MSVNSKKTEGTDRSEENKVPRSHQVVQMTENDQSSATPGNKRTRLHISPNNVYPCPCD